MPKRKHKQNKHNDCPNPKPVDTIKQSRENICYEYGVSGLDSVDCDILLSLENDEKRNAYLKKRFPEGI